MTPKPLGVRKIAGAFAAVCVLVAAPALRASADDIHRTSTITVDLRSPGLRSMQAGVTADGRLVVGVTESGRTGSPRWTVTSQLCDARSAAAPDCDAPAAQLLTASQDPDAIYSRAYAADATLRADDPPQSVTRVLVVTLTQ